MGSSPSGHLDTLYPVIPPFSFTDQHHHLINQDSLKGKIYVADFFFTSCPTICPVMKSQMLRVYEAFISEPDLMILSHTIDPYHDTPDVLSRYASDLGVVASKWKFLTGAKDSIFDIAEHYLAFANTDENAPGGFVHSGAFVLIDKQKHIRGYYIGTQEKEVDRLIADIKILLDEP